MKTFNQFHDGFLDGLLIQGTAVRVFLSTEGRQEFVLEVRGVLSLKVDDFRQGNIILDVLERDGDDLTCQDMMSVFDFEDEAWARKKLEEARGKNLVVLEINPSYGASCIILAESVELLPRSGLSSAPI
jgi:hypothetical protein